MRLDDFLFAVALLTLAPLWACSADAQPPGAAEAGSPRDANPSGVETAPITSLAGPYWRLTHLGEEPVRTPRSPREAHLVFDAAAAQVAGSDGCNRLMGSFEVAGARLAFGPIAGTKMACPGVMAEADRFGALLEQVRSWRIDAGALRLSDEAGRTLLLFEASVQPD